jgi:hypothetical protein
MYRGKITFTFPEHLTADQADALHTFIHEFAEAFWNHYEHLLMPLAMEQAVVDAHVDEEMRDMIISDHIIEDIPF